MKRPIGFDDVKSRLLGHWGSGPGINFAYAHLSRFAKKYDHDMMFVLGPGHGFPALQANLFLEGTLTHVDPSLQVNLDGIRRLCRESVSYTHLDVYKRQGNSSVDFSVCGAIIYAGVIVLELAETK